MKKSDTIRGMLFGVEFLTNVLKEAQKLGISEEQVHEWMKTEGDGAKETAQLIAGAKKLVLKFLALIQEGIQISVMSFSKASFFGSGFRDLYFLPSFRDVVLREIPDLIPAYTGTLSKYSLTRGINDAEIQGELENPTPFSVSEFAAIISNLIGRRPQEGTLLNNGDTNVFYVRLANRTVVAVDVCLDGDEREWCFGAGSLDRDQWDEGDCVFSRS